MHYNFRCCMHANLRCMPAFLLTGYLTLSYTAHVHMRIVRC